MLDTLDLSALVKQAEENQAYFSSYRRYFWGSLTIGIVALLILNELVPQLMLVGIPALYVLYSTVIYKPFAQLRLQRAQDSRELLLKNFPDLPQYIAIYDNPEKASTRLGVSYATAMIAMFVMAIVLGRWNVHPLIIYGLIIVVILLWAVSPVLTRLNDPELSKESREYLTRNIRMAALTYGFLLTLIMGTIYIVMPAISQFIENWLIAYLLSAVVGYAVGYAVVYVIHITPHIILNRKYVARSDHAGALAWIKRVRDWFPNHLGFKMAHGITLQFAGYYEEAEILWTSVLGEMQNGFPAYQAVAAANIGFTLNGQKRYTEALTPITTALQIAPEYGELYLALAEYYLDQEIHPERALEICNVMMRFITKPRVDILTGRYHWSDALATHALSFATQQQFDKADLLMQRAFRETSHWFKPGLAALNIKVGRIKALQGDKIHAVEHFEKARMLDPDGSAGQQATEFLKTIA